MNKRLLYGAGLLVLAVLVTLVVWQGSFTFGDYGPANPTQTLLFWAVSTLVFLLTVILAFILFRTGVKLYIERRTNREGSRIKTKLVFGALALTILPVCFLVLWSVYVLNRNIDKWFSRPAEGIKLNLVAMGKVLDQEAKHKLAAQAELMAALPEVRAALDSAPSPRPPDLSGFCGQHHILTAVATRADGGSVPLCNLAAQPQSVLAASVPAGSGQLVITAPKPLDVAAIKRAIDGYVAAYDQLALDRRTTRNFYLLLLFLLTLFILFLATWIALFLARQISVPIAALLEAAGEVRKGNLAHRVDVKAIDELATLVRGFNEMTEALEANRRELESRRRFTEAILESIPTGVISLSADGRILRANSALRHIFSPEHISRAERLEDLFSREDTAEIKYLMKRARRSGGASSQLELKTETQTLQLAVTVCALETKLTSGFVLVLEDTSELLRAQKAAAWQEVARRIAHEVRNPLTPITLSAERIARQLGRAHIPPETEALVRECTAVITQEVESLKNLLDTFSQFARFPAAQPALSDLNEVVENALGVFSGRLDGVLVLKELAPGLPPVNLDREQFKRVVSNLVDNAAESMQDSLVRQIYVATYATPADTVELVIADTGCGISPEDKEKLFLPYFSTKGRGTGLGLAIVNHILSEHGAHIRVEDNRPAGAKFIVEIPVPAPGEVEPRPAEARA